MKTLDDILKLWNTDSEMDSTEPSKEILKIPKLHNKYLTILTEHKVAEKKANFDYLKMKKIKLEYYSGKMDKDDLEKYGWQQFRFTLKSDMSVYLEADSDLIKLLEKRMYHEEICSVVESIMNELKQRAWQLKSYIQWEMFVAGN